jgi:hypothetical protein
MGQILELLYKSESSIIILYKDVLREPHIFLSYLRRIYGTKGLLSVLFPDDVGYLLLSCTSTKVCEVGVDDDLVAAAKKEGMLTTIALPHDWCNYGEAIETFKTKYGIEVNELNLMLDRRMRSRPSKPIRATQVRST